MADKRISNNVIAFLLVVAAVLLIGGMYVLMAKPVGITGGFSSNQTGELIDNSTETPSIADDGNTNQLQVVANATEAPTSLSLSVNDGAEYTNESRVSLSLSADGAQECRYRDGPDSDWSAYEPYRTRKYWDLSVGEDGPRTVEYQCRGNDNSESEILSAGITLDRQAPIFWYMLSAYAGAARAKIIATNETIAKSITCTPAIDLSEEEPFIIDISSGTGSYMYIRQIMPGDHSFSLSCQDEAGNIKSTMPRAFKVR